jgi:hypothetical protein
VKEQQQQVYQPDQQLVQLQMQFAQALQEAQRKTVQVNRATEVMQQLLPLIEMSTALALGGQQDLANYMRALAAAAPPEVIVGLDSDTADDFIAELQTVEAALKAALHLAAGDTNLLGQIQKALGSIDDLKEAVNDMAVDVDADSGEEEAEEEEDEEEDDSDEPLKIEG